MARRRHWKTRSGLFLVGLVAPLWAGCLGPSDEPFSIPRPQWSSGYSYAYSVLGSAAGVEKRNGETESVLENYGPLRIVAEVVNTTLGPSAQPTYVLGHRATTTGGAPSPTDQEIVRSIAQSPLRAYRQRDLAPVGVHWDTHETCGEGACSAVVRNLRFDPGPVVPHLRFPLENDDAWSGRLPGQHVPLIQVDPGLPWFYEARVVGRETVDLAIGSVEAVRVDVTIRPEDVEAWKQEIREEADEADVDVRKLEIDAEVQQTIYYSETYEWPVRTTSKGRVEFKATGREEGDAFNVLQRYSASETTTLEGARLVPRPERDARFLGELASLRIPLQDPTGAALRPAGYTLKPPASGTVFNAAQAVSAGYRVEVVGGEGLPEGHRVGWRVTDAWGGVVHSGEGLELRHDFDAPGVYGVEWEARDPEGFTTAATGAIVVGEYELARPFDCDVVMVNLDGLSRTGACDPVRVPVRMGIGSLAVRARPSSPVGFLNGGTLELRDPFGQAVQQSRPGNGGYEIRLDRLADFAVLDQDWTLEWRPDTSLLETIPFEIELRHAASAEPSEDREASPDEGTPSSRGWPPGARLILTGPAAWASGR